MLHEQLDIFKGDLGTLKMIRPLMI